MVLFLMSYGRCFCQRANGGGDVNAKSDFSKSKVKSRNNHSELKGKSDFFFVRKNDGFFYARIKRRVFRGRRNSTSIRLINTRQYKFRRLVHI